MPIKEPFEKEVVSARRNELVKQIKQNHKNASGVVMFIAAFEQESLSFKQDPSFWYYTGVDEPAAVMTIDLDKNMTTLFVPNFGTEREKWVSGVITPDDAARLGVDEVRYLGEPCVGYQCHPFFTDHEYKHVLDVLANCVESGKNIFTSYPDTNNSYIEQRFVVNRIADRIDGLQAALKDISGIVADMRCKKSKKEIEYLFKAIAITGDAHYAAAQSLKNGKVEYDIQALIEYVFISSGASIAFPSIVASGKNATVLHYGENNHDLKDGDLVVIDIGARYNNYCADITRTYPVSGAFTKRQRELYTMVLDVQDYIAQQAKPGMWLSNKDEPERSLNHLAQKYLDDKGYGQYFYHGIGHFLGLDVHDVGDYSKPLQAGDVITIEPGVYIKDEGIGIRIEDDYWIVEDGSICLSEDIVKHPDDIEMLVQQRQDQNLEENNNQLDD